MSRPATAAGREIVLHSALYDLADAMLGLRVYAREEASLDADPTAMRMAATMVQATCEAFDKAIESFVSALGSEVSWDDGAAHHAEDFCAALETEAERIEETRTEDDLASRFERGRVR